MVDWDKIDNIIITSYITLYIGFVKYDKVIFLLIVFYPQNNYIVHVILNVC